MSINEWHKYGNEKTGDKGSNNDENSRQNPRASLQRETDSN